MRVLIVISILLSSLGSIAQTGWNMKLKQEFQLADFAFYQEDYVYALKLLANVYEADSTYGPLLYEYGTSLLVLDKDKVMAENLLKRAVEKNEFEAIYWYGRALHMKWQISRGHRTI